MSDLQTRKPNLFLVGAAKAGTTSIAEYLANHPQIFLCPIKEPNYFSKEVDLNSIRRDHYNNTKIDWDKYFKQPRLEKKHIAFVQDETDYLELFREASSETYLLDASTSYLYSPVAASEIKKFNPNAKIIIMLRDPIQRTISHFMMDAARGNVSLENSLDIIKMDFETEPKGYCVSNLYVDLSLYYEQLIRYINVFGHKNMLILSYDELKNDVEVVLEKLTNFIGISEFEDTRNSQEIHNRTKVSPLRSLKKMHGIKKYLPSAVVKWVKNVDDKISTIPDLKNLQPGTVEYVSEQVSEDWAMVKQILGTTR